MKLIVPGGYALYDLIRPVGSAALPLDFEAAVALDARARAAYQAGGYPVAAALFDELARLLTTDADAAHAATLATDRAHALRNAEAARAMAQARRR